MDLGQERFGWAKERFVSPPFCGNGLEVGWKWVGSAGKAWFTAYVWWLGVCFGNFTKLKEFFFFLRYETTYL